MLFVKFPPHIWLLLPEQLVWHRCVSALPYLPYVDDVPPQKQFVLFLRREFLMNSKNKRRKRERESVCVCLPILYTSKSILLCFAIGNASFKCKRGGVKAICHIYGQVSAWFEISKTAQILRRIHAQRHFINLKSNLFTVKYLEF